MLLIIPSLLSLRLCMWSVVNCRGGAWFSFFLEVKIKRYKNLIVPYTYSIYSNCKFLDSLSALGASSFFILLWKGFAPSKIDMFMWLLFNGNLNTRFFS